MLLPLAPRGWGSPCAEGRFLGISPRGGRKIRLRPLVPMQNRAYDAYMYITYSVIMHICGAMVCK